LEKDFGKKSSSEIETDEDTESEMEDDDNTSSEDEYMSGNEGRSSENEEDDPIATTKVAIAEALNLTSNLGIEAAFARVSNRFSI
jgi:hypothetical protein